MAPRLQYQHQVLLKKANLIGSLSRAEDPDGKAGHRLGLVLHLQLVLHLKLVLHLHLHPSLSLPHLLSAHQPFWQVLKRYSCVLC